MTLLNDLQPNIMRYVDQPNDFSIHEHVIYLLMKNYRTYMYVKNNDVPLRYMWSNLNKEERARSFALFNSAYFIIFLLFNLDYDEQRNILQECSGEVLLAILKYWWGDFVFFFYLQHQKSCILWILSLFRHYYLI